MPPKGAAMGKGKVEVEGAGKGQFRGKSDRKGKGQGADHGKAKGKGADLSKSKGKGAYVTEGKEKGKGQDTDFWTRGSGKRFQQVLAFSALPGDVSGGTDTYWSQCWFGKCTLMEWWHTPEPVCR